MAGVTITPLPRIACTTTFGFPVITAGGLILGTQPTYQTYMPNPWAQGDITWQGAEFGFAAGGAGAQVQRIQFQFAHRVSAVAAFTAAQAQVYDGATPVGAPFPLTLSIDYVTDTFYLYTGYPAADLPDLALQVTWHSVAPGLAYVHSLYAEASYSYPSAVTPFTVAGLAAVPVPSVHVVPPPAYLVSLGTVVQTLTPAFGKTTADGNLLLAWTYTDSTSPTFDTATGSPGWLLAGISGQAYNWRALWYKPDCAPGEIPPVFTSGGGAVMSQLAEFRAGDLDRAGTYLNLTGNDFTLASSAADTASGDLVAGIAVWAGANTTPATPVITANDSSGASLPLTMVSNATTTGQIPYAFAWGQASPAAGPGADTFTVSLSEFDYGGGIIASFFALPAAYQPPPPMISGMTMRAPVTIPVRAGRR